MLYVDYVVVVNVSLNNTPNLRAGQGTINSGYETLQLTKCQFKRNLTERTVARFNIDIVATTNSGEINEYNLERFTII
jgi:hypothetical protein